MLRCIAGLRFAVAADLAILSIVGLNAGVLPCGAFNADCWCLRGFVAMQGCPHRSVPF